MAISFVNYARGATNSTTSFSITLPATQAGDILILEFAHRGTGDGTISGTSVTTDGLTWTLKHSQLFGSSAFSGKTYWTRATGDHNGKTVTGASLTNSCAAIVTIYRGCKTTGDPLADATIVGEQNASGNETQAQITTGTAGAYVVLVVVNSPDYAVSSQACTSPGALTERAERLSTGGTDTSVSHASAALASAGATGSFTWSQTNSASGSWAYAIGPLVEVAATAAETGDFNDSASGTVVDMPDNIAGAVAEQAVLADTLSVDVEELPQDVAAAGAENVTASDTAAGFVALPAGVSESVSVADGESVGKEAAGGIAEQISASSGASASVFTSDLFSSGMSFALFEDSHARRTRKIYSSSRWTETYAAVSTVAVAAGGGDTATVSDSATADVGLFGTIAETATVSESGSLGATISASVSEIAELADTMVVLGVLAESISEGVVTVDIAGTATALAVLAGESITLSDTGAAALAYLLSTAESVTVSESGAVSFAWSGRVSETVSLSDIVTKYWALLGDISEGATFSDTAGRAYTGTLKIVFTGTLATITFTATRPVVKATDTEPTISFTGTRPLVGVSDKAPAITAT